LISVDREVWLAANEEPNKPQFSHRRKCGINLSLITGRSDLRLLAQGSSNFLQLLQFHLTAQTVGRYQNSDRVGARNLSRRSWNRFVTVEYANIDTPMALENNGTAVRGITHRALRQAEH
jgi:hypothetical protein